MKHADKYQITKLAASVLFEAPKNRIPAQKSDLQGVGHDALMGGALGAGGGVLLNLLLSGAMGNGPSLGGMAASALGGAGLGAFAGGSRQFSENQKARTSNLALSKFLEKFANHTSGMAPMAPNMNGTGILPGKPFTPPPRPGIDPLPGNPINMSGTGLRPGMDKLPGRPIPAQQPQMQPNKNMLGTGGMMGRKRGLMDLKFDPSDRAMSVDPNMFKSFQTGIFANR
tara:strand:- start:118 stop:798 length:681 start_codon:yes stop_codon:yes gene_type:complete